MNNLIYYNDCCFIFHENVIKSKHKRKTDPTYKERLIFLNEDIKVMFDDYQEKFKQNKLEELIANGYSDQAKVDLQSLYEYKSSLLKQLKITLTTDQNNRKNGICQNCTIGEVNSFDHYVPQTEFAEFSVNPLNLIPCCSKCNEHKSSIWRINGKKKFLNLYIDPLPVEQYLFVNVIVSYNSIDIEYYLSNQNGISAELYGLIENHYDKLDLLTRFRENSDIVISELDTQIRASVKINSIDQIKSTIIEECNANKQLLGHNHWKLVLKMAIIECDDFMRRFNNLN